MNKENTENKNCEHGIDLDFSKCSKCDDFNEFEMFDRMWFGPDDVEAMF